MPTNPPRHGSRRRWLVAIAAAALLLLTACGGGSSSDASGSTQTKKITVTFSGDDVTPNGDRVEVGVDQPIELDVTADKAGEIHVHSDPEQQLVYGVGTTTLTIDPIGKPGVVDIESHALEKTIVQLQVQ
jgi:hypothetical protein